MNRYVLLLTFASLLAIPAQASAFFRCWCGPRFSPYGYRYAYPMPYYYSPYVVPLYVPPSAPPRVYPSVPQATAPLPAPVVTITPGSPSPMVKPEVAPASGVASPTAAPPPMSPLTIPDPMVPKTPRSDAKPMIPIPSAVPSAAPAPGGDAFPIQLPEPRKAPSQNKDELPPLVLPPETPGGPSGVIPPTTSRSSPLTGAVKVQVYTAAGQTTAALRKIGFFNHTDRDLDLVIEGKSVKLPKKSYLNAELPAKFTWKHSGGPAESAIVPGSAAGLDVLFKD
jgi:hypothetical protein